MNILKKSIFVTALLLFISSFGISASAEKNADVLQGWCRNVSNNERMYYINGTPATGFLTIEDKLYFFDDKGYMTAEKWKTKQNTRYYFGKNGQALTGRQIINGKEYTFDQKGRYICPHVDTDHVDSSNGFYTYAEMTNDIIELQKSYPEIMSCSVIGITADKRNIYDIVIGDPKAKKQIVYQASCHAREYMTSLLVMEQLEYCLNNYYTAAYKGVRFKDLFSEYAVHIIPMLNPDGVTISQFGKNGLRNEILRHNAEVYYKNAVTWGYTKYTEENYYRRWKANAHGVDINNNFDGKWDTLTLLNGPVGWGYRGNAPECETESKCITRLIRSLSNPVTVISYHATGSVLWWDYGQTGEFRERCEKQMQVIKRLTGYKLQPYTPKSAGGLCDWIIEDMGEKTVPQLIEIGVEAAPLKDSEYPEIWRKNRLVFPAVAYLYYNE